MISYDRGALMFNEHKITCENSQSVLYLFTQPFDTSMNLVKGIFEHLHEDVLLDWADDYLDTHDISFGGDIIRVLAGSTIVRDLNFPLYMKKNTPIPKTKILNFMPMNDKIKKI